ncbi:MAG: DUF4465 domain-containing protein [Phycisphaerales bacterium]|nr:MAG: DUF4465 domain-containing protein [Phycisphaerales bacterium]
MVRHLALTVAVLVAQASVSSGVVVDLEDLPLAAESYWNGSDGSGGFPSRGVWFSNNYDSTYGSWDGFAYSNITDTTAEGWSAQYNAIAGGGRGGSANYAVYYRGYGEVPSVTLDAAAPLEGVYVTNVNYAYYSMLRGDAFAKKFGGESGAEEDWFLLTVTGRDEAGEVTGTAGFYLADYRFADGADDYIVDGWEWLDLASLGVVKSVELELSSSDMGAWGMNTPGYFALDDLSIVPEPATLVLLGAGGVVLLRRRRV